MISMLTLSILQMIETIRTRRSLVRGVLAAQNLKFTGPAYPGDTIEVMSKLSFSDDNGFKTLLCYG